MSEWGRINGTFYENAKVRRAGRAARDVYLGAILYCIRNDTDGFIPAEVVGSLDPEQTPTRNRKAAEKLTEVDLLLTEPEGFSVPNYDEYQRSSEQVEQQREQWRKRQKAHRDRVREYASPESPEHVTRDSHANVTRESRDNRQTDRQIDKKTLGGAPRRDEVWDTLEEIFGTVAEKTNAHGKRNRAAGDLRRHGATPELISRAHKRWSRLYPNASITDIALATHYPQLSARLHAVTPPCAECGIGGGEHVDGCSFAARATA